MGRPTLVPPRAVPARYRAGPGRTRRTGGRDGRAGGTLSTGRAPRWGHGPGPPRRLASTGPIKLTVPRELPLGSRATVTNLANGRTVEVEISDRGPYAEGRVIDLSEAAAARIGLTREDGTAPVLVAASAR